jgi:hypothetical protein
VLLLLSLCLQDQILILWLKHKVVKKDVLKRVDINIWPIDILTKGDVYVADGFAKVKGWYPDRIKPWKFEFMLKQVMVLFLMDL